MKRYKARAQKILIVLMTLVMLTVSIPKPVQADFGGVLFSPITALITTVADAFQWLLEWVMLGRPNDLMDQNLSSYQSIDISKLKDEEKSKAGFITITEKENGNLDGALFGLDRINVPDIQYTPENIFSNRIPALDVNFINPSVKGGENVQERNIAQQLQGTIASWYKAIRILAVVGLLSVLIYLGIRILMTSVAAEKAKYKKILLDWLVAVCLIFALHYIMSLILTGAETVTALISKSIGGDVYVTVEPEVVNNGLNIIDKIIDGDKTIKTNLMGYVRFMVQSTDLTKKAAYLVLYIMLVIYNIRFTWTYLKRVVNMAFLTLIAPVVALTYPIDKVGDGKAQAFGLWLREYIFNALLQPLHLLLYIVLLGSAIQLATKNPLYAIVALGFILSGEKLLKQMFGFGKAGAGTVGSLGGAAAVTALATKAVTSGGKKFLQGGGNGKVRTNDRYERQGKNQNANKDFNGFMSSQGIDALESGEKPSSDNSQNTNSTNAFTPENEQELAELQDYFNNTDNNDAYLNGDEYQEKLNRMNELEEAKKESENQNTPEVQQAIENLGSESQEAESKITEEEPTFFGTVGNDIKNFGGRIGNRASQVKNLLTSSDYRKGLGDKAIKGVRKNAIGAWKALPAVGRGALKVGARAVGAGALGLTALAIGATSGDGEKALGAMAGGILAGSALGGKIHNSTIGKNKPGIKDSFGAGKYGSAIDYRNEKADKAYLKSQQHKEEYEKYFKEKMSKEDYDKAVKSYRESGITDTKTIRKALKLEEKYRKNNKMGDTPEEIRKKVQNIAQSYEYVNKKAVMGGDDQAKEAALKNIEGMLNIRNEQQRRRVSNEILQGYRDWYNADF